MPELINSESGEALPIASMPKSVLQSIYHAVTGKTENLAKTLSDNVLIRSNDFENLYLMLRDQLGVYDVNHGPTTTVILKSKSNRSTTYSSWERFKALNVDLNDLTSDITLKIEFVVRTPGTDNPNRCIIIVNLDSALPLIDERSDDDGVPDAYGFLFVVSHKWNTARVSIDFVDFLVARSFLSVAEEWFSKLQRIQTSKLNTFLLKKFSLIRTFLGQCARMGFALFLAAYVLFNHNKVYSLEKTIFSVSVGIMLWAAFRIFETGVTRILFSRITANIIPSIIIMNETDERAYQKVLAASNSPLRTLIGVLATCLLSVLINLLSSYIYSAFTGK